ncbi:uncharacterized protein LOC115999333 [Ipomoea triloba]|uniref:uncharacterized protein LOC115999333 n=1 Tax=Ipomoea triloba TaxID=35885 RepID=UPI00125E51EF|nr:uncharacterized protein LOC115999333 [Ipomoea triloba]
MHKHCFEALDKTMRDLLRFQKPFSSYMTFGGKTIAFGGDFRYFRLQDIQNGDDYHEVEDFAKWIADIGDGVLGVQNDVDSEITIIRENLLNFEEDPIATIVKSAFPMFQNAGCDQSYLENRVILASTLDVVDSINEYMNAMNEAEGVPNHSLTLKVGSPVMLLRNIDYSLGLCNGTRLIVTILVDRVLEAKIISGAHARTKVLVSRMSLIPSDSNYHSSFNGNNSL